MISEPSYRAAGIIAERIENHFAANLEKARRKGEQELAPVPTQQVIETIIDAAFWASLRREEGHPPRISLAFLPPEQAHSPLLFGEHMPLRADVLTKLAPGVERGGTHLGVWIKGADLYLWGITRQLPNYCFVLDVSEPGLLVVKHRRRHGYGKYANIAVLTGDQLKLVDEQQAVLPDCPTMLSTLLGYSAEPGNVHSANILIQLAVSMRSHGKGGSLLLVPSRGTAWRHSIMHPIRYKVDPAFAGLADLLRQKPGEKAESIWQGAMRQQIGSIADLTAIDGATVLNSHYELLAFGAKITRSENSKQVDQVMFSEPVIGGKSEVVHPSVHGGTRHISAAQFVYDQHDALALVASQDGRFTIYSWSVRFNMVRAHRIDALLL